MKRRAAALVLLLAAAGLVVFTLAPRGEPSAAAFEYPAPAERGETEQPDIDPEREQRFARVVASMWWHLPRFENSEELALRQQQVVTMDGHCLKMLRRRAELQRRLRTGQPELRASLEALELGAAEQQLKALEASAGELALIETSLVIDVLAVLNAEQRDVLLRDHPVLFKRPWLKTLGGERPRRGAARSGGDASESERSRPAS